MDDSIQACFRNEFVFEQTVPVRDRQLAGNDEGLLVIAVIKDLLKVVLELSLNGFHSKVMVASQFVCLGPGLQFKERSKLRLFR